MIGGLLDGTNQETQPTYTVNGWHAIKANCYAYYVTIEAFYLGALEKQSWLICCQYQSSIETGGDVTWESLEKYQSLHITWFKKQINKQNQLELESLI